MALWVLLGLVVFNVTFDWQTQTRAYEAKSDAVAAPGQLETLLTSISRGRAALNQGNHHEHARAH